MKEILDFLTELKANNNREWFNASKDRFRKVDAMFTDFTGELIAGVGEFDPAVRGLTVKDCTYRIYRDTRFSYDKTPYKTHMGAYICAGGKKSGRAGYYFHIEPQGDNYLGGSLWACGLHCPTPVILSSVREEIELHGDQFEQAMANAHGYRLDQSVKLKRAPKGYSEDSKWIEYLKLKEFSLMKSFDNQLLDSPEKLLKLTLEEFRTVVPFNEIMNKAVEFTK